MDYDDPCNCRSLETRGPFLVAIAALVAALIATVFLYLEHVKDSEALEPNPRSLLRSFHGR